MTDRVHSLTVVLDENMRTDDVEALTNAIRMMKHVIAVDGNIADPESYMAQERARRELGQKLIEVVYPPR